MSTPTETAPPKLSRVDLLPLLRPGQEWLCAEGGELVIILSIDVGTMYPVLYEWSTSKHEGRDSADGFIRDFRPADPLGFLASLQAALATLQAENAELRDELEAHANQEVAWKLQVDDMRERLAAAEVETGLMRRRAEAAERGWDEARTRATAAEGELARYVEMYDIGGHALRAAEGERDRLRELIGLAAEKIASKVSAQYPWCEVCGGNLRMGRGHSKACYIGAFEAYLAAIPHTEGEASAPPKETTP